MELIKDKNSKFSFAGIALSGLSTIESAAAVLDGNGRVIKLDKLFAISDVKYFLDNFPGKHNAVILVSIPDNEIMLGSKWKYNSRTYDLVNFDVQMLNREDWTNRHSSRGSEYFKELRDKGIDIFRFNTINIKKAFGALYAYKDRSPASCKALQDNLRIKYNMYELPRNMLPAAQLEALTGAIAARSLAIDGAADFECRTAGEYQGLPVIAI